MSHTFRYLPDTEKDKQEMLEKIGISSIDDLFDSIPASVRQQTPVSLPKGLSELALTRKMKKMAHQNISAEEAVFFLGAGTYDHFIPSVVDAVIQRSEFLTAYTPYQPEASQGELQALFEYQSMICELTGMDVSNSSLYDGFTSLGEACNLAVSVQKRPRILYSGVLHPQAKEVLHTYAYGMEYQVEEVRHDKGHTCLRELEEKLIEDVAAVIIQYPNFLGTVEDLAQIKAQCDTTGTMLIVMSNPLALGVLESPGKLGADVVVGDMQPLGIPMSYGGPHCGYFTVLRKYMRKVPSRIVGETVDADGKRGYVMTLQTREQHIRREKATSNMSSNQALSALASAVCMSALGKQGIKDMALQNIQKAHALSEMLSEKGWTLYTGNSFFNEFVVQLRNPISKVNAALLQKGIMGGLDVSEMTGVANSMLICVTEKRTLEEMQQFVHELEVADK